MKVRKDRLRSWLVIMRHVAVNDPALPFPIPDVVIEGMVENRWLEVVACDENRVAMRISDEGRAESDLAAADYGIDALGGGQ